MVFNPRKVYGSNLDALKGAAVMSEYVHPDYLYYKSDWDKIRDVIAGERRVKEQAALYLPPMGDDETDYTDYISRAVFTNLTARTLSGFIGTVFRRPVKITGLKEIDKKALDRLTPEGMNAHGLAKRIVREILAVGRVGLLCDRDAAARNAPYAAVYLAENILSWRAEIVEGKEVLKYVLLREILDKPNYLNGATTTARRKKPTSGVELHERYRVLALDELGEYTQTLYSIVEDTNGQRLVPELTIKPTRNGFPIREIPFWIAGPEGVAYNVQKSPLLDITTLNLAHYRTSAQLEHGRFYTALPIYYVPTDGANEEAEYIIGPSRVWEVSKDTKPGILEYYGTGLSGLATSMLEKEHHITQLGGRVAAGDTRQAQGSENNDVFNARAAHETSVLLNATEAGSDLLTRFVQFSLYWDNKDGTKAKVIISQEFKLQNVGARELRAVALLYQSGILPVDELYRVLQESEFLSEDLTLEQFKAKLSDLSQFPNQPDVDAMHEGYPNMQSKIDDDNEEAKRMGALEKEVQKSDQKHALVIQERSAELRKAEEASVAASDRKTAVFERKKPVKPTAKDKK